MKIAVCIKQVPTREWQPRLKDDKTWIREQDVSYERNEPDAYALEEALRLREKPGGEVVACSAGPARAQQVIRVVLAERLGIPHSTIIMDVQVQDGALRIKRELEGGWFQWITMPLPALLTIQSGINQLRYATLKGIMAAKKKEIRKVAMPGTLQPAQAIVALSMPTRSK